MNTVRDLLVRIESPAHSVSPDTSLVDCARAMIERDVGALSIVRNGELQGLVSWHDVLDVVASGTDRLAGSTAADVMTREVATAAPDDDLEEVESTMVERQIHHVPVVDGAEVIGMISQQTIVRDRRALTDAVNKQLSDYIREHYQKGLTTGHRLYESSL